MRRFTRLLVVLSMVAATFTVAGAALALPLCNGEVPTIVGTTGDDVLVGTPGKDVILAKRGDDQISAGGGNDVICGGSGDDVILAGDGDDIVFGNDGTDVIDGGAGDDTLFGNRGRDTIDGGPGADVIEGNGSTDRITGGPQDDTIFGGDESDIIKGQSGNDTIYGQGGADRIWGGGGDDVIRGQAGDDKLRGGPGDDVMYPGPGDNDLDGEDGFDRCISKVPFPLCEDNDFNDPPAANNDAFSTNEDTVKTGSLFANNGSGTDSDPNGDSLSITAVNGSGAAVGAAIILPSGATVTVNANGAFTYSPVGTFDPLGAGESAADGFTYTVSDPGGESDTAEVAIEISGINDAPVAGDDAATTNEDTSALVAVLDNDEDPDSAELSVTIDVAPAHGVASVNGDGAISYTPAANYNGADSITYSVADGDGGSDSATLSITVLSVNDAPIATDDGDATLEDVPVTIDVLDNDIDVDGDELEVTITEAPGNGDATVNPDGSIEYAPDTDFNGSDSLVYQIDDGNGGTDSAEVNITVAPVQDAPTAGDDSVVIDEDTSAEIVVLDNDIDPDGDELTVTIEVDPLNGSAEVNLDGSISYTPNENYNGSDSLTYMIDDGNGGTDTATVAIIINPVNDAPIAGDDSAGTSEDLAVNIDVLDNDSDVEGDELTVTINGGPAHGLAVVQPDSSIDYTPAADYNGSDGFSYLISDGNGGSDIGLVNIFISPVPDAPVAVDDLAVVAEDSSADIDVLDNDFDVDGDDLTVTIDTFPADGIAAVNPDGSIAYSPDGNFNGSDSIVYSVSDGTGRSDDATVSITVTPVNDAPVALADTDTTFEDVATTIDVLDNDTDIDGDTLSIELFTQPEDGSVAEVVGGLEYTPDPDFNGIDTFSYTVSDGNGGFDTATVTVTVSAVADAPVAADDTLVATEDDASVSGNLFDDNGSGPDFDADGDSLVITFVNATAISGPHFESLSNGTIEVRPDGTYIFTPGAYDFLPVNSDISDLFEYTVSDGALTDTAAVEVVLDGVNDDPVAGDDPGYATDEETLLVVAGVLDNDDDVDAGDVISVTAVDATSDRGAELTLNPDGTIDYDPVGALDDVAAGALEDDTFEYTVSDGNGGSDIGTVTVTVTGINDDPIAGADAEDVSEDGPAVIVNVRFNDEDIDGDALDVTAIDISGTTGQVTILGDDTIQYSPNGKFESLHNGETAEDTFGYTIVDGNGGTDDGTVTITVIGVTDPPVAGDDTDSTNEDTPVIVDVQDNDSDIEGDSLTVTIETPPTSGGADVNLDGTVTYTPNPDFNGGDSFVYQVDDGFGGTDTATVTVTVLAVADAPAAQDDEFLGDEDTPFSGSLFADNGNGIDIDVDGDPITVTEVNGTPFTGSVIVDLLVGDATVGDDGSISFTPDPNVTGADSFSYTLSDGALTDAATVTITVADIGDAPVADDDGGVVSEDGPAIVIDVLDGDTDPDGDVLSIASIDATGTLGLPTIGAGVVDYDPNGAFESLDDGEFTFDTFTYDVTDGDVGTADDTGLVTVTVNGVNDAPVAGDDSETTDEDTAVTIDVLDNDTDVDVEELSIASFTQGTDGVVTEVAGELVYTPGPDFNGSDSFTYVVTDGDLTDEATVDITVNAVADGPVADDDAGTASEDGPAIVIDVLDGDTDPDGDVLSIASIDATGTLGLPTIGAGVVDYDPNGAFESLDDGEFTFDTFTYDVTDGDVGTADDTGLVTVTVNGVNDAPVAGDDSETTDEDTAVTIDVLDNDTDVDVEELSIASFTQGTDGVVTEVAGELVYTPGPDFNGSDSFTYVVTDGDLTDEATVDITVNAVNDAPVADDDAGTASEDGPAIVIDVLDGDTDPDGDVLSIASIDATGTLGLPTIGAGVVDYDPNGAFESLDDGEFTFDTFTYDVTDGDVGTADDTGLVTVTVNGVNDAPVAGDDSETTDEDTAVTIDVLDNDTDVDVEELSIASFTQGTDGVVTEVAGELVYTPGPDFNGSDSFTYVVTDGDLTDEATVDITVNAVNDAPVADDDAATTFEDVAVTIDVVDNDSDIDGDTLSIFSFTDPEHGTVVEVFGELQYTPDEDYNGPDSFTYTVTDSDLTDSATVTLSVLPTQDDPIANDDSGDEYRLETGLSVFITGDVLANDTDADGDTLAVSNVDVTDTVGTVTYEGDGTFTYQNTGLLGEGAEDTWDYTVSDGFPGGTDIATVTIRVNSMPIAGADTPSTDEDTAALNIVVLTGDTDGDGDELTVTGINSAGTVGAVTLNPDGTVDYDPDDQFEALGTLDSTTDSFDYSIADGFGGTDTETVTVTITGVNDAPEADNALIGLLENDLVGANVYTVLGTDVDSPTLTYSFSGGNEEGRFTINPVSGLIEVAISPDYETTPLYTLSVDVSDGETSITATVAVQIFDVNEAPSITSSATFNAAENQLVAGDVDSTDPDAGQGEGAGLTYSLTDSDDAGPLGVDNGLFTIDANTGVLSFGSAPDFETPGDNGGNNVYDVQVTVTDSGAPGLTDVQDIAVTVTDVNEAPTDIALDNASVDENQPSGTAVGTFTTSDVDPDSHTYTLVAGAGDTDNGQFAIVGDQLQTAAVLNFEAADNCVTSASTCSIRVQTDDGDGGLFEKSFIVTIGDVNDAPVITSDLGGATAAVNAAEGQTAVTDVDATDPESGVLTYSLSGGADELLFSIDANSGVLTFNVPPDFESPGDAGTNNVYDVQVTVTDSGAPGLTDVQDIAVTVTDVLVENTVLITVDNEYDLYVNGSLVGSNADWLSPETWIMTLVSGDVVAVRGTDVGGNWGFAAEVTVDGTTYPSNTIDWKAFNATVSEPTGWADKGFVDSGWGTATASVNPPALPAEFSTAQWIWEAASGVDDTVLFRFVIP